MSKKPTYLKVTCYLASPIAGDLPMLDALIEYQMAVFEGKLYRIRKDGPVHRFGEIHIPMLLRRIGGLEVPACSAPIIGPAPEHVEYFGKRLAVEYADLLAPGERKVIAITNSVYKSYHLPLIVRPVDRIVWFCVAKRRPILLALRGIKSLGKKRSQGYGVVARWEAEYVDEDYSWYAPSEAGRVLMRPLPDCDELPADLIGYRPDFGAVQPPYWHPDRYVERVVPC